MIKMVRVSQEAAINPAEVSHMQWERRSYMNGPGPSTLVIRMRNGDTLRIEHNPGLYGGVDAYEVEKKIMEACE